MQYNIKLIHLGAKLALWLLQKFRWYFNESFIFYYDSET